MANITGKNITMEGETQLSLSRPKQVSFIITIIIHIITCPFTVLLNVMVIMAVKRRPRLQTNANILLACLATTDAFTGLTLQPTFILWSTSQLLGMESFDEKMKVFRRFCIFAMTVCSPLHLMLVTCERLIAIRFTEHYTYIVVKRNIKVAVIAFWIFSIFYATFISLRNMSGVVSILNLLATLIIFSCIFFIASAYVILYRETLRHRKMIKTQQLPQEEVERFAKESKALKTTVLVVGAVVLCFLPAICLSLFYVYNPVIFKSPCLPCSWVATFYMFNSFINPLIYCWRQKEMRQFIFRLSSFPVAPLQN